MTYCGGRTNYFNKTGGNGIIRIPLLYFCRYNGLSLPLIALQYHDVKVLLNIQQKDLISSHADTTCSDVNYGLIIFIWIQMERRFAQTS